jgi:hypothetical protein
MKESGIVGFRPRLQRRDRSRFSRDSLLNLFVPDANTYVVALIRVLSVGVNNLLTLLAVDVYRHVNVGVRLNPTCFPLLSKTRVVIVKRMFQSMSRFVCEREKVNLRISVTMGMRKKLAFVSLLLFLLTIGAIAFHHHGDGGNHDDCPVCVAASIVSSAGLSFFSFAVFIFVFWFETLSRSSCFDYLVPNLPFARAPPA